MAPTPGTCKYALGMLDDVPVILWENDLRIVTDGDTVVIGPKDALTDPDTVDVNTDFYDDLGFVPAVIDAGTPAAIDGAVTTDAGITFELEHNTFRVYAPTVDEPLVEGDINSPDWAATTGTIGLVVLVTGNNLFNGDTIDLTDASNLMMAAGTAR